MTFDSRWKFPQGKSPEHLYDALYQLIRELRKGDYLNGVTPDLTGQPVSNIDFANSQRVLGRNTAGGGPGEEVTLSQLLDWVGSAAQGDILVRGASDWTRLPVGASGEVVTSDGTDPGWAAPPSATSLWEQIGDSGDLGNVANVEFTFTAGDYSKVIVLASDILGATNASTALVMSLRNAGGAIITLTSTAAGSLAAAGIFTGQAEFAIGLISATKRNVGRAMVIRDTATGGAVAAETIGPTGGANATAADRVRVNLSTNNIADGRVTAYGLLATAP